MIVLHKIVPSVSLGDFPLLVLIKHAPWGGTMWLRLTTSYKMMVTSSQQVAINQGSWYNCLQETNLCLEICDFGSISFPNHTLSWDCSYGQHGDCSFSHEADTDRTQENYERTFDIQKLWNNKLYSLRLNLWWATNNSVVTNFTYVLNFYILIVLAIEKGI